MSEESYEQLSLQQRVRQEKPLTVFLSLREVVSVRGTKREEAPPETGS